MHCHNEDTAPIPGRAILAGLVLWAVFCAVAVALHGVQWDEAYERAQAISGQVAYPEEHPLYRFAHDAPTITYDVAAWVMKAFPGPLVVCTYRNVLHLWMMTAPVFLLAAVLARSAWWGHAAALLIMLGLHTDFASYYPLVVWPNKYTAGHIGMGYALLVLGLFAWNRPGLAIFLLALMPMIHLGHMPVLLPLAGAYALWTLYNRDARTTRTILLCGGLASAITGTWLAWKLTHRLPPLDTASPYFSPRGVHDTWLRYTFFTDVHRAYPRFGEFARSNMALGTMLLLGAGMARAEWRQHQRPGPAFWLWTYTAMLAGVVWAILGTQAILGTKTPFLLVSWMPHRLPNHVVLILIATGVAAFARLEDPKTRNAAQALFCAVLAGIAVRPVLGLALPASLYERYVAPPGMALFFVTGAALAFTANTLGQEKRPRLLWTLCITLALGLLVLYHKSGFLLALAGIAAAALCHAPPFHKALRVERLPMRHIAAAAAILVLALLARQAWTTRTHLPVPGWQTRVAAYLEEHATPDAMLAAPASLPNIQEATGHPVLATYETQAYTAYDPKLGPSIEEIYGALYGYRFGVRWHYDLDTWRRHSKEEWQRLARYYNFEYVISPKAIPLPLEAVLEGDTQDLYRVPAATLPKEPSENESVGGGTTL